MGEDGFGVAVKKIGRRRSVVEVFDFLSAGIAIRLDGDDYAPYITGLMLLLERSSSLDAVIRECSNAKALASIAGRWYGLPVFLGGDYGKDTTRTDVFEDVAHFAGTPEVVFVNITPAVLTAIQELSKCAGTKPFEIDKYALKRYGQPLPKSYCKKYAYCGIEDLVYVDFIMVKRDGKYAVSS